MSRSEQGPPTVAAADLVTGHHMHGYGRLTDGREFAVRVSGGVARLEIYRELAAQPVPAEEDVELLAERSVAGVDVHDERSAHALVSDMAATATPPVAPSLLARAVASVLG